MLFGILIATVIIIEPRGIYGLWLRIRNYFKAWPFSLLSGPTEPLRKGNQCNDAG